MVDSPIVRESLILWGGTAVLLVAHIVFRIQAQRRCTDSSGDRAPFRLRMWPLDQYPVGEARRYRDLAIWSGLLFLVTATAAMLLDFARGG
jgi:hypothetical protein